MSNKIFEDKSNILFLPENKSVMKKATLIGLITLFFIQGGYAQKYIKYIFLENKVKIVIPVKLEKKDPTLFQGQEVIKVLKAWQTKKADATLLAFEIKSEGQSDICKMTEASFSQLSFMTSDKSIRSTKTLFINNRQEVCLMEITSSNNTDMRYEVIFTTKTSNNSIILFYFNSAAEKKKHWQPIINGIIKDLTIQL